MVEPLGSAPVVEGVSSRRLRALIRYWNDKRGDRPMPRRAQIDPIEIPQLLPIVLIADVTSAGVRMRLLGTEATSAYGQETRGCLVSEIQFGEFTSYWRDAFALVAASAAPASAGGAFRTGNLSCGVEMVLLPLTNDDVAVSQIFGGLLVRSLPLAGLFERPVPRTYIAPFADQIDAELQRAECSGR